jgi:hypothetical protein
MINVKTRLTSFSIGVALGVRRQLEEEEKICRIIVFLNEEINLL